MRNSVFQEDRAKDGQEIEELRFCCEEADRARHLKTDELSMQQRQKSFYRESAFGPDSGPAGQCEFPE